MSDRRAALLRDLLIKVQTTTFMDNKSEFLPYSDHRDTLTMPVIISVVREDGRFNTWGTFEVNRMIEWLHNKASRIFVAVILAKASLEVLDSLYQHRFDDSRLHMSRRDIIGLSGGDDELLSDFKKIHDWQHVALPKFTGVPISHPRITKCLAWFEVMSSDDDPAREVYSVMELANTDLKAFLRKPQSDKLDTRWLFEEMASLADALTSSAALTRGGLDRLPPRYQAQQHSRL